MKLKSAELEGMTRNELESELARLRAELAAAQSSRQQAAEAGARATFQACLDVLDRLWLAEVMAIMRSDVDPAAVARAALQTMDGS